MVAQRGGSLSPPARIRSMTLRLFVPVVLLGLWMMHGMSATMESGCHGMPLPMPMAASIAQAQPMTPVEAGSRAVRPAAHAAVWLPAGSNQTGAGELCLSGRPPAPGAWLLAALLLVGCAVFAAPARRPQARRAGWQRWRGPPGLAGIALLTAVCVSRT